MATPILKIKRQTVIETGIQPTTLTQGELAVDLISNRFYVGTDVVGTSVPISTKVVDDATFPSTNDSYVATEKGIKTYLQNNYNPSSISVPPKNVFSMRIPFSDVNLFGDQYDLSPNLATEGFNYFIDLNTNNFIKIGENFDLNQFGTGLYQTTAKNMFLHVNYSVSIKSVSTTNMASETNINFWRSFGMYVIDINNNIKTYYGVQTSPPVIGTPTGLPTMLNGSAIVKLPKYRYGSLTNDGGIFQPWELRFFSQIRSSDTMYIGNIQSGSGVNDPTLRDDYKIKIEIVKLTEELD